MRHIAFAAALAFALAGCAEDTPAEPPATRYSPDRYQQAITDIGRLDDLASDAQRLPGELLAFAQVDRGEVVGDYIMGGGYVTRLLAIAVGRQGKVYAFQPDEFIAADAQYATDQDQTVRRYTDAQGTELNVFALRGPLADPGWPEPLDTIITVMNFHDLYRDTVPAGTPDAVSRMLFDSLKPGGVLVVVDHQAADDAGVDAAQSLHRMDRNLAMTALTEAGFLLEAESDLYARPEDPRTASVFDEGLRKRSDQFAWRLRRPQ
ncbi:methyltransferase [Erythrobacter arachoides]|uniref:Methyltransferase n=1 Tax=Aurantiacibacter arachoides TaxID=1850444 RepID=A0A845AA70_9SPHN|nr:methyltransferase [Aurantiacibacter arachoides]MXO94459.1 methyltransferase [Aurantiacibacter arachoides]GGD63282.1 methyltransferase [Aurantiacibacter arachoides]